MREIEARGKNINTGEWEYGSYARVTDGKVFIVSVGKDHISHIAYTREVKEETVGQFIGICDKNNVKIYEGDMVKTKYGRICVVVRFLSDSYNCWDLQPVNRFYDTLTAPDTYDLWKPENLEVVGNIYDNPDMPADRNKEDFER